MKRELSGISTESVVMCCNGPLKVLWDSLHEITLCISAAS